MEQPEELRFEATAEKGEVSALWLRPTAARWALVLGHGAGGDMRHRGMELTARALATAGVATFRYQFPYAERGGGGLDPQPVLVRTVRAAVRRAISLAPELPLLAGGRSMGGRMTSLAAAEESLPEIVGLVFYAFPLHPAGKPGTTRAEHLRALNLPLLFLQGERDALADLSLLEETVVGLGEAATLYRVPEGDHSFKVPKRTGKTEESVAAELAHAVSEWAQGLGVQRKR